MREQARIALPAAFQEAQVVLLGRIGGDVQILVLAVVSETLDKVCEILGIDEKMTWYTARDTFISSELDAGTPITHVAEMAGNSARTIEKHYYKNTKQKELRQRMNARYGS